MPRKNEEAEATPASTAEEWKAQEACPECGGRPGWDPETGILLRDGHRDSCRSKGK